jgi:hypothetical protein
MSAGDTGAPRNGSRLWWLGVGSGLLAALATPTAVLGGLLLAPALLALVFDTLPQRLLARPILFCGLAAALRPLLALWTDGHTMAASLTLAADLTTVGLAWAAQAAAWLLGELLPLILGLAQDARARARIARLRDARARLEQEWGLPPSEP